MASLLVSVSLESHTWLARVPDSISVSPKASDGSSRCRVSFLPGIRSSRSLFPQPAVDIWDCQGYDSEAEMIIE